MIDRGRGLDPYVPRVASEWDLHASGSLWRTIEGTLVFVDISGFTNLSERLARRGRIGAEELTAVLNRVFGHMLEIVFQRGGSLLKFGGDALLLLFDTSDHLLQACAATVEMRAALREASKEKTSVGRINLRMSSGIHTGSVDFFLVGESHRELLVTGPTASVTTEMEGTADAGEIVVSGAVKESVPGDFIGDAKGNGWLLRKQKIAHSECGPIFRDAADQSDLGIFVPARLRDFLVTGIGDSEHRIATIGFLKFKGVDALLEAEGPQTVGDALDQLVTTIQQAGEAENLTFLASDIDADGGKIILAAGVPASQHDDEGRMLRAGRQILDSDLTLSVRMGINRGHVFAGDVGSDFRRTFTVMGDTVNLAARLMAAAGPRELYSSPSVLNLSSTLFRSEALEPFFVKGKEQAVQAFSVLEDTGVRPPEVMSNLPFRGREAELEMLVGIVNTCSRVGHGGMMTIVGGTGVGKSRLIAEVLDRCDGMDTLMIQAEPAGVSNPYWAFRDPLRRRLEIERSSQEEMAGDLARRVEEVAPDLSPMVPLLGDVLHIAVDDNETTAAIEPQFRPDRGADALIELLSAASARPIALVVEDGQWLDEASRALLARIGESAVNRPWTILITARADESDFEPMGDTILLHPLSDAAIRVIAVEVTRAAPLRPHDLSSIVEKADGNPLFLGEILRVISETGSTEGLPDSLDAIITTEIDTLRPLSRQLLRYSSVLGRRFRRPVLDEFLAPENITLDEATNEELSRFLENDGDERLMFRHNTVHEIAYGGLSYSKRRELHARAGDVIERQAGDDPDSVAEYLATHYSQSGSVAKAWHYSLVAGDKARDAYANAEAAAHYQRAIECSRTLEVAGEERAAVFQSLGDTLDRLGEFEKARQAYKRAFGLFTEPESKAALLRVEAAMLKRTGHLTQALRAQTKGLKLTSEHDLNHIEVDLFAERATIRHYQGRYRQAMALAQRAIDLSEDPLSPAVALAELTADYARTVHEASTDHSATWRALKIAEANHDLRMQGSALNNLGMYAYYDGKWSEAGDLYARASESYLKTGDEIAAAYGVANTAEIKAEQGHWDEAEAGFLEALHVLRSSGESFMTLFVLTHLGRLATLKGRFDDAFKFFDEATQISEARGASTESAELGLREAQLLLAAGRVGEAQVILENSELSPANVPFQLRPLAHQVAGLVAMCSGRSVAGQSSLLESLEAARASGSVVDELHAIHALAAMGDASRELIERAEQLTSDLEIVAVPIPRWSMRPASLPE